MKINKASLFALYAVLELASDPESKLSTLDIASKYGISANHLAKVMNHLIRKGLVTGVRGANGGCRFTGNIDRTTLLDIINLFESQEADLNFTEYSGTESGPVVAELKSISAEIDNLTTSILGSVSLSTTLKNIGYYAEAECVTISTG